MEALNAGLKAWVRGAVAAEARRTWMVIVISVAVLLLVALCWFVALRTLMAKEAAESANQAKMTLEPIAFDLRRAVDDVAELLAMRAREKGLELIVRYAPDTPQTVVGDPGRVRQILLNLLNNAVEFTSAGHVLIDVGCTSRHEGHAVIRFAVEDNEEFSRVRRVEQARGSLIRRLDGPRPFTTATADGSPRLETPWLWMWVQQRIKIHGIVDDVELGIEYEQSTGTTE